MKRLYLQGLFNELAGRRDQSLADISVLLDSPAGIGEHGGISEEIKSRLNDLDKYDSLLSTFDKFFRPREEENKTQPMPTDPTTPTTTLPTRVLDEGEEPK